MLHGAFDFVLMLMELLANSNTSPDDTASDAADNGQDQEEMNQGDLVPLLLSVGMVILGLVYYCCEGQGQRKRLHEMDQSRHGGDEALV